MAATRMRGFRSPDSTWEPAKARAEREGVALGTVINDLLDQYTAGTVTLRPASEHQPA